MHTEVNRRILIIDDNRAIHEDFRKILSSQEGTSSLEAMEAALFNTGDVSMEPEVRYTIESAYQGEEGYRKVCEGLERGERYAAAFIDMRMPPGWDGVETIEKIWQKDPSLEVVICTAYSDHSWSDLIKRLGRTDRLLILKKPFDTAEVSQLACSLTEKWHLAKYAQMKLGEVEELVRTRTLELEEANNRLRHDSLHDRLTGLANRALLLEHLNHCLGRMSRDKDFRFGAIFLDLDRFKVVNDSLGHLVGDELLIEVAKRLVRALRSLDTVARFGDGDLARLGGDEFVVLAEGITGPADLAQIAMRINQELSAPIRAGGHDIVLSASIGIAVGHLGYSSADAILRDADIALYRAKAKGKMCYEIFDPEMHVGAVVRLKLESELRAALEAGDIQAHCQPLVSLTDGRIMGFEALARWRHAERGIVSPADFIPLAEETGLIVPMTHQILRQACGQVRQWQRELPNGAGLTLGVNLSARLLTCNALMEEVNAVLGETEFPAEKLALEVTEGTIWENPERALQAMKQLRAGGLKIHLDDFGTGQSSLSHVHRLPVDAIKIDRSFVRNIGGDDASRAICELVVRLSRALRIESIGEGVETFEQCELLSSLGCDLGQGYLFSPPVPASEVPLLMSQKVQGRFMLDSIQALQAAR